MIFADTLPIDTAALYTAHNTALEEAISEWLSIRNDMLDIGLSTLVAEMEAQTAHTERQNR